MTLSAMEAGGARLEVRRIAGAADGPTLVFLHEGLGSAALWRDFPDRVAAATGLPALLYSRRGYGRSDPVRLPRAPTYLHDEALAVLPEVLERLGIGRRLLVGHSDGASIALIHAAAACPCEGLAGVVAMAPHVVNETLCRDGIRNAVAAYERGGLRARLARHHDDVEGAFRGWSDTWLGPGFADWTITALLPRIRVPVLAIQGRQDEYGTLAHLDAIAATVPGAGTLVLEACGHFPQRDQPDHTLDAIVRLVEASVPNG